MSFVDEIWRPIDGFEGSYSVSNLGRVRSEKRTVMRKNGTHIAGRYAGAS